ncbi:MAG: hypothetical protein P8Z71_09925 [Candidatus Sulfobium sp.]
MTEGYPSAAAWADSTSAISNGVADAIRKAEGLYAPGDVIVVTGSFYTIGEAKEVLGNKGVFSRLRE